MSFGDEDRGHYDEGRGTPSRREWDADRSERDAVTAQKITLPGIFMIVTGVLNLLGGLGCGLVGWTFIQIPAADLKKAYDEQGPHNQENLKNIGVKGPEDLRNIYVYGAGGTGVVAVIGSLINILGGVLMCMRKAYWLCVLNAFLVMVPCVSLSACPCVFGIAVGIWALVALFSADAKAAFG